MDGELRPIYEELPSGWFRLLTLKSAIDSTTKVQCTLTSYRVEDAPPYQSLSYTWGEPRDFREIDLNGRPFQVRPNLESALRRFREEKEDVLIWIDVFCIN